MGAFLAACLFVAAQNGDLSSLVQELRSDDLARRNAATAKLEKLGADALPTLTAALVKSTDPEVRSRLEKIIGEIEVRAAHPRRIVFTRGEESQGELYLWENDEVRRLTDNKVMEAGPRLSPDGARLVYFSMNSLEGWPKATVSVMTLSDRSVVRIGTGFEPAWSPDGARIAFLQEHELHVAGADGSGDKILLRSKSGVRSVCWSSDGKELAVEQDEQLWIVAAADGTSRRVGGRIPSAETLARWSWSPDGKTFGMIAGSGPYLWNVYTMNADGTGLAARTEAGWIGHGICGWAPDSRRLAVCVALGSGAGRPDPLPGGLDSGLHLLDTKLGTFRKLVKETPSTFAPLWSPDGRFLIYVTEKNEIWICNVPTGAIRKITDMEVPSGAAGSWFPPSVHWK